MTSLPEKNPIGIPGKNRTGAVRKGRGSRLILAFRVLLSCGFVRFDPGREKKSHEEQEPETKRK
jgi:hypothetical protein